MGPIHDRMPVFLDGADAALWLDPAVRRPELLLPLLWPYSSAGMEAYAVSPLVNDVRNEGAELIVPLARTRRPPHEPERALPTYTERCRPADLNQ